MSGEKVIYNLLSTNAALIAVVPVARIYPSLIPLGTALPAIAYSHVSTVEETSIGLTTLKVRSRIQITVAASSYSSVKTVMKLVKDACKNKQGTFAGVKTDSVLLENGGADFRDDEASLFYQTIDFKVTYSE